MNIKHVLLIFLFVFISGCSSLQLGGAYREVSLASEANEIRFEIEPRVFRNHSIASTYLMEGEIDQPEIVSYLERIAQKLVAQHQGFHPKIRLTGHQRYNACASLDGTIRVNIGVIFDAESEDEVAALLAHELSHVILGHNKRIRFNRDLDELATLGQLAITDVDAFTKKDLQNEMIQDKIAYTSAISDFITGPVWSRPQERQADANGMELLIAAGYSPEGMLYMVNNFCTPGVADKEKWHQAMGERIKGQFQDSLIKITEQAKGIVKAGITEDRDVDDIAETMVEQNKKTMEKCAEAEMNSTVDDITNRFQKWSNRFHEDAMDRQETIQAKIDELPESLTEREFTIEPFTELTENKKVKSFRAGMEYAYEARKLQTDKKSEEARKAAESASKKKVSSTPYVQAILSLIDPGYLDIKVLSDSRGETISPLLYDIAVTQLIKNKKYDQARKLIRKGEGTYGPLFSAPLNVYLAKHLPQNNSERLDEELQKCKLLGNETIYSDCQCASGKKLDKTQDPQLLVKELHKMFTKESRKLME